MKKTTAQVVESNTAIEAFNNVRKMYKKPMMYEETPIQLTASKKFVRNSDNKKLGSIGSGRILIHLYQRYEIEILYGAVFTLLALEVWNYLGI